MLHVHLWVEARAAQGTSDHRATLWSEQSIAAVSILLVEFLHVKVKARHGTEKQEVNASDCPSEDQNDTHQGIKHHGVVMTTAVISVTVPENVTDDEPDDQQALHENEESSREVKPVLISVAKHRNLKEIQDTLG